MKWVKILILSIDKAYVFDFDYTFQYKYKYVAVTFQAYVVDFDYTFQYKYKSLFITSCRSMFITSLRLLDGFKKKKKTTKGKRQTRLVGKLGESHLHKRNNCWPIGLRRTKLFTDLALE